jgi:hypothetical protein
MTYKLQTKALIAQDTTVTLDPPDSSGLWHIEKMFVCATGSSGYESTTLATAWDSAESKSVSIPNKNLSTDSRNCLVILWRKYTPNRDRENETSDFNPEAITW